MWSNSLVLFESKHHLGKTFIRTETLTEEHKFISNMIDVLGTNGFYGAIFVVVIAVASLFGLVIFASKEEKFEDVVAAQRKEQEVLIQSLNSNASKPSKSKKKWTKIKREKSNKIQERKDETDQSEVLSGNRKQIVEPDVQKTTIEEAKPAEAQKQHHEEVNRLYICCYYFLVSLKIV